MPQVRWLLYRLRTLWRRQAQEAELDAELQFHIETEAEEQIEAGLPPDHARQAALRALGNVTLAKEDARAVWTWGAVERLLQDVRYAIRVLARQKSFTATAVATIVLIVGGTTAVFTLVNAVLLRPLPYPASDRLVIVRAHNPRGGTAMNYRDFERLHGQLASVEAWGLYRPGYGGVLDSNSDRPLSVQDMRITPERCNRCEPGCGGHWSRSVADAVWRHAGRAGQELRAETGPNGDSRRRRGAGLRCAWELGPVAHCVARDPRQRAGGDHDEFNGAGEAEAGSLHQRRQRGDRRSAAARGSRQRRQSLR